MVMAAPIIQSDVALVFSELKEAAAPPHASPVTEQKIESNTSCEIFISIVVGALVKKTFRLLMLMGHFNILFSSVLYFVMWVVSALLVAGIILSKENIGQNNVE